MAQSRKSSREHCGEACLLEALSETAVALLKLGPDRRIQWYSGAWRELTGLHSSAIGKSLERYVAKEDWARMNGTLTRTLEQGEGARCELRVLRGKRGVRQVEVRLSPTDQGVFAVLIDVTERSERLAFALESAELGLWDWDVTTGHVLYLRPDRPGATLVWAEQMDAQWHDQCHPHDTALAQAQIQRVVQGQADRFLTVVRMRASPDRPWRQMESRGKATAWDKRGRATRIVGVYRNVTESITEQHESRERDSAMARTSRLFSMEELTSSLAHELNQPLGAVSNFAQAALRMLDREVPDTEAAKAAMRKAVDAAAQPAAIVRGMRNLVQRAVPQSERVDAHRLLEQTAAAVAPRAQAQGIRVDLKVGREPIRVHVDRVQIEQVLHNLIGNAMDSLESTRRRGRQITVEACVNEGRLSIAIADNGHGIPAKIVNRLFTPFVTTKPGGMGLGLPISRSIIEAHGGRLWLAANGPGGATICFDIPLGEFRNGQGQDKARRNTRGSRRR